MRLLQRKSDGSYYLTRDLADRIPPYAILSHTWGPDDQEITFQDAKEGTGRHKEGYRKIEFCGAQAALDGLDYFWVDTCCIDKSSSAELQEAINSMFRWYQQAKKCYVYLSDVLSKSGTSEIGAETPEWKAAFRICRWMTRGWTLQELLAPTSVDFFSKEGQRLGDKRSLEDFLHEITRIPTAALRGTPLSEFSETERMSWSDTRSTKREEDRAYSLLGLFGIHMPMIYGEGNHNALRRLREEIGKKTGLVCLPRLPDTKLELSRKTHFIVPFGRNENFVGRGTILAQLLGRISPSAQKYDCQRTVIEGLGGIGKTQIALEAAYCIHELQPECSVFWVPVVNTAMFENAYREIGQALGIQGTDNDKADIKTLVKTALGKESAGSWLMIIDNADDTGPLFDKLNGTSLHDALPFSRKGSILFTTRNHEVSASLDVSQRNVVVVEGMNSGEAIEMLQSHLGVSQIDQESTEKLISFLAYLPLAIKQAASYMIKTRISTAKYLGYCLLSNKTQAKLLSTDFEDRNRYPEIANSIATTWIISFDHIAENWPLAAEYLKSICYFAEKDVPRSLLPGEDEMEKDEAFGVLKGYAFIIERETPGSFDIHRLVRLAMQNWIKGQGEQKERVTYAMRLLDSVFPFPKHENKDTWVTCLPHALATLELQEECLDHELFARFLSNVAECYYLLGKYIEAERFHQPALTWREKALGHKHPDTLSSMDSMAKIFGDQGKYSEAERMHRKTLALRETVLGRMHPDTLTSLNNLANVLDNQGKYFKAEEMHRETLVLRETVLGHEYPDTLKSMNNLGLVLNRQGKYSKAEEMHRKTLALSETVLGREHADTLASMNNLALVFCSQGKYEEAEKMHRKTLALRETVLGREHPSVLDSMNNLANVLFGQAKYSAAEEMHRETLALTETMLGCEHPYTLDSMNNLAEVFHQQENFEEAKQMHQKTLDLKKRILGREHPSTLNSMNNLATVLDNQGDIKK